MKIFISYATEDRRLAGTLYEKMVAGGADVFQFGRSETAGKPSWTEILAWIKQSDVFVLLVSRSSVLSRAVNEELNVAYYAYVNSDAKKPAQIIPAIIEKGVVPPDQIEHFTRFDLTVVDTALPRLLKQLGLERAPAAQRAIKLFDSAALPDPSELFRAYSAKNPEPSIASLWSKKATKIATNYNLLKPKEISPTVGSLHLRRILKQSMGGKPDDTTGLAKYDALFFGLRDDAGGATETPDAATLPKLLLSFDAANRRRMTLDSPEVHVTDLGIEWTPVFGALVYAVERSTREDFSSAAEVYRGVRTAYKAPRAPLRPGTEYYRVKAIAGVFGSDSQWSAWVKIANQPAVVKPPVPPPKTPVAQLATPTLRLQSPAVVTTLEWTAVEGAIGYVLERSDMSFLLAGEVVYDGEKTTFMDFSTVLATSPVPAPKDLTLSSNDPRRRARVSPLPPVRHQPNYSYRVKAKARSAKKNSDWSNVVHTNPAIRALLGPSDDEAV